MKERQIEEMGKAILSGEMKMKYHIADIKYKEIFLRKNQKKKNN